MRYDAFISYSHTADAGLAPAVQAGLQRLAKPWYRRRALSVFRDETSLAVDPSMWDSIIAAMDNSRYFVLLASPGAAASSSVNREITHWLQAHPAETVLPVLTHGSLEWSRSIGDYDPAQSTALPPALQQAYQAEPHHLDLRWARSDEAKLDLRHSRFRAQLATLAAAIHGVSPEDIEGEDIRAHRRSMRLALGAVSCLVALTVTALIAMGFAVSNARSARRNSSAARLAREQAEDNAGVATSRQLAGRALSNTNAPYDVALLEAAAASRFAPTAEARDALVRTVVAHPEVRSQFRPTEIDRRFAQLLATSPSRRAVLLTSLGGLDGRVGEAQVWDLSTDKPRVLEQLHYPVTTAAFASDATLAVVTRSPDPSSSRKGEWEIIVSDTHSGAIKARIRYPNSLTCLCAIAISSDGLTLVAAVWRPTTGVLGSIDHWDLSGAPILLESIPVDMHDIVLAASRPDGKNSHTSALALSSNGKMLVWTVNAQLFIRRFDTGEQVGPVDTSRFGRSTLIGASIGASVSIGADNRTIESSFEIDGDVVVVLWDSVTRAIISHQRIRSARILAFSPDLRFVALRREASTVVIADPRTDASVSATRVPIDQSRDEAGLSFAPEGIAMLTVAPDGGAQVVQGNPVPVSLARNVSGTASEFDGYVVSQDGRLAARPDVDGRITIVDTQSGEPIRKLQDRGTLTPSRVWGRFSPDGGTFALKTEVGVTVFDMRSEDVHRIAIPSVVDFAVSRGGQHLYAITPDVPRWQLRAWRLAHNRLSLSRTFHLKGQPEAIAVSSAGVLAISYSSGPRIDLISTARTRRSIFKGTSDGLLAFSPDGSKLALATEGGRTIVFSVRNGRPIGSPLAHEIVREQNSPAIAFDDWERTVATGEPDGGIQLWDLGSGLPIGPKLIGHAGGAVESLAFRRPGRLISAASDGLRSWDLTISSLRARACRRADRELTRAEWLRLIGAGVPYLAPCA